MTKSGLNSSAAGSRACKNVSKADALKYVAGYTCGNDVSARDRQRQVTRERRLLKELRAGLDGLPLVELPFLAGGVGGPDEVRALAGHLAAPAAPTRLWTAAGTASGRRLPSRSGAPASRGSDAAHPAAGEAGG